jgi:hypothetical protein
MLTTARRRCAICAGLSAQKCIRGRKRTRGNAPGTLAEAEAEGTLTLGPCHPPPPPQPHFSTRRPRRDTHSVPSHDSRGHRPGMREYCPHLSHPSPLPCAQVHFCLLFDNPMALVRFVTPYSREWAVPPPLFLLQGVLGLVTWVSRTIPGGKHINFIPPGGDTPLRHECLSGGGFGSQGSQAGVSGTARDSIDMHGLPSGGRKPTPWLRLQTPSPSCSRAT